MLKPSPPTTACRCWSCGADDPMGCGALCADCSWDDHCGGMAYNGNTAENWEVKPDTPTCCREAHASTQNRGDEQ